MKFKNRGPENYLTIKYLQIWVEILQFYMSFINLSCYIYTFYGLFTLSERESDVITSFCSHLAYTETFWNEAWNDPMEMFCPDTPASYDHIWCRVELFGDL